MPKIRYFLGEHILRKSPYAFKLRKHLGMLRFDQRTQSHKKLTDGIELCSVHKYACDITEMLPFLHQLIIYRKDDIKASFGIDLNKEKELKKYIGMRIDLLLGDTV